MSINSSLIPIETTVWGPGVWMTLHIIAYTSNKLEKVENFISIITDIIKHLPCEKCRIHSFKFIKSNDFKTYKTMTISDNNYIGPFKWMCMMHNNANKLLGKPQISWINVYKQYSNITNLCDGPCSNNGDYIENSEDIMDNEDVEIMFVKSKKTLSSKKPFRY